MTAEPRQKIMLHLGESGCYLLCLVKIAEELRTKRIDAVATYLDCVKYNLCRDDCYILDPAAIMHLLYGGRWSFKKEGENYKPHGGEFEILRYEWATPARIWSHFVLGNGERGVAYDPLGYSNTVARGEVVSKRILKLEAA
jgi:hypothetical protein